MKTYNLIDKNLEMEIKTVHIQEHTHTKGSLLNRNLYASYKKQSEIENAMQEINSLIGMKNLKKELNKIINRVKFDGMRNKDNKTKYSYHFAFLGNPGTGKTTAARLLGKLFKRLGILKKGHIVEVDRGNLVSKYVGETAELTKAAVAKAEGGILFIDEAYSLSSGGKNDHGKEAVDTLLKLMEDKRGEFITIFAGYADDMKNLWRMNSGFEGRITHQILFEDYTEDELCEIACYIAAEENFILDQSGRKAFKKRISALKIEEDFSNARAVRTLIEEAINEKACFCASHANQLSEEELTVLNAKDFKVDLEFTARDKIKKYKEELNSLTGLGEVKKTVNVILNTLEFMHKKEERGLKSTPITLHMQFTGNPGTGKTTVARIMAAILKETGILKKGQLVEASREDFVGEHIGETGPKTLKKIKEAYGGVLFIDEAYALCGTSANDFGREALAVMIKEMEENRDKLSVILAGYSDEMKELMDLNPGLKSRIKYNIEFPDYTAEELCEIFENKCRMENYMLTDEALEKVKEKINKKCLQRDRNFGNAREIRKYFEKIEGNHATRIIENNIDSDIEMMTITAEDIEV